MSSFAAAEAPGTAAYKDQLRLAIEKRLRPTVTFETLLGDLDGADPLAVVRALEVLATHNGAAGELLAQARNTTRREPPARVPIAHPLDYAWEFTTDTSARLVRRIAALTEPGQRIVHLGTPSLHARAVRELPDREHVLVDRDRRRVDATVDLGHTAFLADLLESPVPRRAADVCVTDPPWYPGDASCFLNAAATMLRPGGLLLLAFGGSLTRPGMKDDRDRVLEAARADGLVVEDTDGRGCRYTTPPFEYSAMASAGLRGLPSDWRTGELITLRRRDGPTPKRRTNVGGGWTAIDIDDIPLRVRASAPVTGTELLCSLVEGDVLATVSRRAPVRDRAALWTSRNRIFGSATPLRLLDVVSAVGAVGWSGLKGDERRTASRIRAILDEERREHGLG